MYFGGNAFSHLPPQMPSVQAQASGASSKDGARPAAAAAASAAGGGGVAEVLHFSPVLASK